MENLSFNYSGAIHIHSDLSDGTGDINSISKAAKHAGLDWIIITDHNNFEIQEGFYNGVCVIRGEEVSPKAYNHYLALGIKELIEPNDNPQVYIDEVRRQGGFGFSAHPDESAARKNRANPIKWLDKSIIPDGVEIWNWFSDWADNYNDTNIFNIAYGYIFRHKLIKGPHKETLEWWDKLNNASEKIIPAIAGVDAHALKISKYVIPVKVFPYKTCFKTLTNIITLPQELPKTFDEQKALILEALRNGNNIIVNRHIRKETPIIKVVENSIQIKISTKALIKILHNGDFVFEDYGDNINFDMKEKGKYRIEIYLNNEPWIFSNPILFS